MTGLAGLATACASGPTGLGSASGVGPSIVPVNVARSQIARVDVGLRPYRETGFRVEREQLGSKAVIHNYGHGGGGITLSWGTSRLALDEGFDPNVKNYAVLGAGIVGLSTAHLLLEQGAKVTIYAKALSPHTTSNVAGGQWWPASVYKEGKTDADYMAKHVAASRYAFRRFQMLTGPEYGISWEPNYILTDRRDTRRPAPEGHPMREFVVNLRDYEPGELPFAPPYVRSFDTLMIDTPHYLRLLERDVRRMGGEIIVRTFDSRADVVALPETVIFNCTGLGAKALFGDEVMTPARGQLVILKPQPEIDYNLLTNTSAYMFGRRDGIVLGGTFQRGNWSLEADDGDTARILAANAAQFGRAVGA